MEFLWISQISNYIYWGDDVIENGHQDITKAYGTLRIDSMMCGKGSLIKTKVFINIDSIIITSIIILVRMTCILERFYIMSMGYVSTEYSNQLKGYMMYNLTLNKCYLLQALDSWITLILSLRFWYYWKGRALFNITCLTLEALFWSVRFRWSITQLLSWLPFSFTVGRYQLPHIYKHFNE